jgi:hypothetical protein
MREVEMTTQHLISDGFDIGTGRDPYKNFSCLYSRISYLCFSQQSVTVSEKRR